jgi:hypothetical protein
VTQELAELEHELIEATPARDLLLALVMNEIADQPRCREIGLLIHGDDSVISLIDRHPTRQVSAVTVGGRSESAQGQIGTPQIRQGLVIVGAVNGAVFTDAIGVDRHQRHRRQGNRGQHEGVNRSGEAGGFHR